jgi:hypothetical protein
MTNYYNNNNNNNNKKKKLAFINYFKEIDKCLKVLEAWDEVMSFQE